MNIKISDSWLREFIDTKATSKQIADCLSLCSQSVEKIIPADNDFIYDIEITTNRPDCLSVYGIARELIAILPRFNIPAKRRDVVYRVSTINNRNRKKTLPLNVKIFKSDLCPRFTALIYDNIVIKSSPQYAQKRLNQSGIRALNNVVDISNYLMLELGQPMHTFDYDKILKNKMLLRESRDGEEIVTLDSQKRTLKQGVMIIEDGEGRLVDLCGIMGAKNSETDENTKRVLLFVQTYNPMKIRTACQSLAFRTEAASRFEKGIDPEGVIPAMERATLLFKDWCNAKPASQLFDIYPNPAEVKTVGVNSDKINQIMGVKVDLEESQNILESLGFKTKMKNNTIEAVVPHWRNNDIEIPEDLVEEIARIYGYHNLPNVLPPITSLNFQKDSTFEWEDKIKDCLKHWGFTETSSYSMVGKNLTSNPQDHLKITNPLTDDLVYLRTSLIPSLLEVIAKNKTETEIKIFEMANIYLPQGKDKLPQEIMELTLVWGGDNYLKLKGILEALINELGTGQFEIEPSGCLNLNKYAKITIKGKCFGIIGETKDGYNVLEIELPVLLEFATQTKKYTPLPKYPPIIEDFSFVVPAQTLTGPIIEKIRKTDELIKSVKLIDSYENTKTFRITYQSESQNLTDKEVGVIRKKIIKKMDLKHNFSLNSSS